MYVYDADVYCDACGEQQVRELNRGNAIEVADCLGRVADDVLAWHDRNPGRPLTDYPAPLAAAGTVAPLLADMLRTPYDEGSDRFPMHFPNGGEADSPQHCGCHAQCCGAITLSDGQRVGAYIPTTLTEEGRQYVRDCIADGGLCAVEVWAELWPDLVTPETD